MSSSSGRTCPGSTTGRTSERSAWQPQGGARPSRAARAPAPRARGRSPTPGPRSSGGGCSATAAPGCVEDDRGPPRGLDDRFLPDLDAALEALREAGLARLLVVADFLWFASRRHVNGVAARRPAGPRARSRPDGSGSSSACSPRSPSATAAHPTIAACDLMNEPEWATLGVGTLDPRRSVSRREMRGFLPRAGRGLPRPRRRSRSASASPARAGARSSTGCARLRAGALVREPRQPDDARAARRGPAASAEALLLGEFPTRGASLAAGAILDLAAAGRLLGRPRLVRARHRPGDRLGRLSRRPARLVRPRGAVHRTSLSRCRSTASTSACSSRRPERGSAPRADRRRRRPPARAAAPRLLDGHLPLAGRAAPLALARPPHGAAGRRAARLPQPAPHPPSAGVPAHARHRLHRGR